MNQDNLKLYYFQITDVWKLHCELHSELFDLTCDEYMYLLESNLDKLDHTIEKKNEIIEIIRLNELERERLLASLSSENPNTSLNNFKDLVTFFSNFGPEKESKHLFRFNELLVDIITKIQNQNKKNQLFINKALHSLKVIREEATGKKSVTTYNKKGVTNSRLLNNNP